MLTIGERIRTARKAATLSLRALAGKVGVSAQAISKYENNRVTPNSTVLRRLARATGVRVEFFFRTQEINLSRPAYRKRTTLPKKQQDAILGQIQEWLERYLEVETLFPQETPRFSMPEDLARDAASMEDIEALAIQLREKWGLGTAPIENLMAVLEHQGIKIGLVDGHEKFDAYTYTLAGNVPVIVTKRDLPGDRQRFNIAHELGHYVLQTDSEAMANRFAGAFLAPDPAVRRELGARRSTLSVRELHILKHKYGLSMQAWIYRAKDLGILSQSAAARLFRMFSTQGWRRQEPGDPVLSEVPSHLNQWVYRALAEGLISRTRAAELLGESLAQFMAKDVTMADVASRPSIREESAYAGHPARVRH